MTGSALVVEHGFYRRRSASISLSATVFEVERPLLGRLLGYATVVAGDLEIDSPDGRAPAAEEEVARRTSVRWIEWPDMAAEELVVHGAREHNLKDITVRLPRNRLICITGLSGSGKSSLAFDTIYAEGQRRYVESLSAYARQFLQMMEKPDVDHIDGLSPAISIDQKTTSRTRARPSAP